MSLHVMDVGTKQNYRLICLEYCNSKENRKRDELDGLYDKVMSHRTIAFKL